MKYITLCVYDKKYFTFRQYSEVKEANEKEQDYQNMGYFVYSSPVLDSDQSTKWIELRKIEHINQNKQVFDPSGAFIG